MVGSSQGANGTRSDTMIDPLLRKKKEHIEIAESWRDDPWDHPSALALKSDVETDVVREELRHLSRPLVLAVLIVVAVSLLFGAIGLWYLHEVNPSQAVCFFLSCCLNTKCFTWCFSSIECLIIIIFLDIVFLIITFRITFFSRIINFIFLMLAP